MAIRDILVVIDDTASVPRRVAAAAALSGADGARLTGLFVSGFPIETTYGDIAGWMQLVDAYRDAQRGLAAAAEAAFRGELARRQMTGDWIYREAVDSDASQSVISLSALYDLVLLGQSDPDREGVIASATALSPAAVVLGAGAPVLVLPYAGEFATIGKRVLVAWNASREAARALRDATFALEQAEAVTILEVAPTPGTADAVRVGAAEVAAALKQRGIPATAETETADDIGIADLLLSRAADLTADLLVMGAWGHSRLREYVLGGVSRSLLQQTTVPVLMAH